MRDLVDRQRLKVRGADLHKVPEIDADLGMISSVLQLVNQICLVAMAVIMVGFTVPTVVFSIKEHYVGSHYD